VTNQTAASGEQQPSLPGMKLVESGLSAFGPLLTKCGDASLIASVPALLDEVSPFDTVPDVDEGDGVDATAARWSTSLYGYAP
jgi:hypothetical protein